MKKILAACLLLISIAFAHDATIDVIKTSQKLPILAIEDGSINYTKYISKKFYKVLLSDMQVVSHFNILDKYTRSDFISDSAKAINKKAKFLIKYKLKQSNQGLMLCDFKLLDAQTQTVLVKKSYKITKQNLYIFLAHEIAVDINDYFNFSSINWMKKRVIFSRYISPRNSEIVISDYSLSYQKVIIRGGLNIFPKWADAKQLSFYYTSLANTPALYKYDLLTGEEKKIITSEGMLVCSDVNKNFDKLLLTLAPSGQPDIYEFDTKTKKTKQITKFKGIDVNGQYLDDEKRIAFVSNRIGTPNIYAQTIGEKGVEQLVFYGKNNNSCSTHGKYIVYTSRETNNAFSQNSFNLHMISTQTEFVRHLTATGVNQFPKFSKDGSAIMFIKHFKHQSAIGIIRLKENKSFLFPLKVGKIQSIDW